MHTLHSSHTEFALYVIHILCMALLNAVDEFADLVIRMSLDSIFNSTSKLVQQIVLPVYTGLGCGT